MSKLELKQLSGPLQDTFSLHSFVVLLLLGRGHTLVLHTRTCILTVGLIDAHHLALILSSAFALDFAFLPRITLQFLHDSDRVIAYSTQGLVITPAAAPMIINATTPQTPGPLPRAAPGSMGWDGLQTAQELFGSEGRSTEKIASG